MVRIFLQVNRLYTQTRYLLILTMLILVFMSMITVSFTAVSWFLCLFRSFFTSFLTVLPSFSFSFLTSQNWCYFWLFCATRFVILKPDLLVCQLAHRSDISCLCAVECVSYICWCLVTYNADKWSMYLWWIWHLLFGIKISDVMTAWRNRNMRVMVIRLHCRQWHTYVQAVTYVCGLLIQAPWCSVVCVYVCLCWSHARTLQKRMDWSTCADLSGPRNDVLVGAHIGASLRIRLHDARVVVVRLYVSLLCPLVTISVIARLSHDCYLPVLFHMGINASIWTVVGGMA